MILITLGTQDKGFERLLKAVEKQITENNINEEVIVQAGHTKFESKNMKIFDLIPMDEFDDLIKSCDLLITHGGVGSIITGLKNNKKVIAAARLKKYGEHTNDHQLQIIDNFSKEGYILNLSDFDKLNDVIQESKTFEPKKYVSNTKNMIELIEKFIDDKRKVLFVASTGGHLSELLQLNSCFKNYDYNLITERTASTIGLIKKYPNKVNYLVFGTKDHIFSYIFKFGWNILKSIYLYIKIRPKYIITTGTHTAVPICYIGKLFRSKIIFIETFANSESKTLSGKMIYPIADLFIVQWQSMLKLYPKAIYGGWIY